MKKCLTREDCPIMMGKRLSKGAKLIYEMENEEDLLKL